MKRPKPTGTGVIPTADNQMSPRFPAGTRVFFHFYPVASLDRWACGSDVFIGLANGTTHFLRVGQMRRGQCVELFPLTPASDAPSAVVVPWGEINQFGVAIDIVTPVEKGVA